MKKHQLVDTLLDLLWHFRQGDATLDETIFWFHCSGFRQPDLKDLLIAYQLGASLGFDVVEMTVKVKPGKQDDHVDKTAGGLGPATSPDRTGD